MEVTNEDLVLESYDINIDNGSQLETETVNTILGHFQDSFVEDQAVLRIEGPGSQWNAGDIFLQRSKFQIYDEADVNADWLAIGSGSSIFTSGRVRVDDGGTLTCNHITMGGGEFNDLYIVGGGNVSSDTFEIGSALTNQTPLYRVQVVGQDSTLTVDEMTIGVNQQGFLSIQDNGRANFNSLVVSQFVRQSQTSRVDVVTGGHMEITGEMCLGNTPLPNLNTGGFGHLTIESGGRVVAGSTKITFDEALVNYGKITLDGGELDFGTTTLRDFEVFDKLDGLLEGAVILEGDNAVNTVDTYFQIPSVDTTGVSICNQGRLFGGGTLARDLKNSGSGTTEINPFETMHVMGNVSNELGGEISNAGGTLNVDGDLTNNGFIFTTNTLQVSGEILNQGEIEFGFSTATLDADVDNSMGGQINLSDSSVTINGDLHHEAADGSAIHVTMDSQLSVLGTWSGDGNFSGPGNVVFFGDMSPGLETDVIHFEGNAILSPGLTTHFQIGGLDVGEFDRLEVDRDFVMNSQLSVTMINGFQLQSGMEFEIANVAGQAFEHFAGLEEGSTVGNYNNVNLYITYLGGDGNDVVLTTTPPVVTTLPETLTVIRGDYTGGVVADLTTSDNDDVSLSRRINDFQARTEFEVTTTSPTTTPSSMRLTIEGAVFARADVIQSIRLFDHTTSAWEVVDSRSANRFIDRVDEIEVSGIASRFVHPGTRLVRARIGYNSVAQRQNFASNTDQVVWHFGL